MFIRNTAEPADSDYRLLEATELFRLCADNRNNSDAWIEFLHRFAVKLKHFIHGTLQQALKHTLSHSVTAGSPGIQESDLFQSVVVRLIEKNCAAMKRFSGASENDLLAYLAVICRSTVLDALRRSNALKRRTPSLETLKSMDDSDESCPPRGDSEFEREILAREIVALFSHAIGAYSGQFSVRDQLIFQLHFFEGLSYSQIAQCNGINLSKAGVEKLLRRLVDRVQILAASVNSEETMQ